MNESTEAEGTALLPPTFTDNKARVWTVELDVTTIKRVRKTLQVDLLATGEKQRDLLMRLSGEPVLLANLLFVICQEQAELQKVTDEEFGRGLGGDSIAHATEAMLDALVNFTPNPRDRMRMRKVLGKMDDWMDKARDVLEKQVTNPEIEKAVIETIATHGRLLQSSLELSASTPDPSASES